jgi:hypothetical protein
MSSSSSSSSFIGSKRSRGDDDDNKDNNNRKKLLNYANFTKLKKVNEKNEELVQLFNEQIARFQEVYTNLNARIQGLNQELERLKTLIRNEEETADALKGYWRDYLNVEMELKTAQWEMVDQLVKHFQELEEILGQVTDLLSDYLLANDLDNKDEDKYVPLIIEKREQFFLRDDFPSISKNFFEYLSNFYRNYHFTITSFGFFQNQNYHLERKTITGKKAMMLDWYDKQIMGSNTKNFVDKILESYLNFDTFIRSGQLQSTRKDSLDAVSFKFEEIKNPKLFFNKERIYEILNNAAKNFSVYNKYVRITTRLREMLQDPDFTLEFLSMAFGPDRLSLLVLENHEHDDKLQQILFQTREVFYRNFILEEKEYFLGNFLDPETLRLYPQVDLFQIALDAPTELKTNFEFTEEEEKELEDEIKKYKTNIAFSRKQDLKDRKSLETLFYLPHLPFQIEETIDPYIFQEMECDKSISNYGIGRDFDKILQNEFLEQNPAIIPNLLQSNIGKFLGMNLVFIIIRAWTNRLNFSRNDRHIIDRRTLNTFVDQSAILNKALVKFFKQVQEVILSTGNKNIAEKCLSTFHDTLKKYIILLRVFNPLEFENLKSGISMYLTNLDRRNLQDSFTRSLLDFFHFHNMHITPEIDLEDFMSNIDRHGFEGLDEFADDWVDVDYDVADLATEETLFIDYFEGCEWKKMLKQYMSYLNYQVIVKKLSVNEIQSWYIIEEQGILVNILQNWTNIRGLLPGYELMFELLFNLSPWFLVVLLNSGMAQMLNQDFVLYLCQKLVNLITFQLLHPTPEFTSIAKVPNLIKSRDSTFENSVLDKVMQALQPMLSAERRNGSKLHITYFSCFNIPTREAVLITEETIKQERIEKRSTGFTLATKNALRNATLKWFKMFYENTDPRVIQRYENSQFCSDLLTKQFFSALKSKSDDSEFKVLDETTGTVLDTRIRFQRRNYPRIEFLEILADPRMGGAEESKQPEEERGEEERGEEERGGTGGGSGGDSSISRMFAAFYC